MGEVTIDFAVSASPMLTSLVTFLFSDKKVTLIIKLEAER